MLYYLMMKAAALVKKQLLPICAAIALAACGGGTTETTTASSDALTCSYCGWIIEVQTIQTISGTCSMNDCGYGAQPNCSMSALMDVQEPSVGQIKLDPMIPGLLRGIYFEGTIDTITGSISTTHSAFPASTLIAGWNFGTDTIGGQIVWEPNASCKAIIDFTGELKN